MNNYILNINDQKNEYRVVRRKVKTLRLKVKSDLTVEVVANKEVPLSFIKTFVEKNAHWVFTTLEKTKSKKVLKQTNYLNGDTIYFLGKAYCIELIESTKNFILLNDDVIIFHLSEDLFTNYEVKGALLEKWYKEQAKNIFNDRLKILFPLMESHKIDYPNLKLRKMKSCWGTCHYTKNFIVLNTLLVKYPIQSIDYVILHELVHFIHHNHSKDFYCTLESVYPNWKEAKALLKNNL